MSATSTLSDAIVIRPAEARDAAAIGRLARLDTAVVPAGDLVVAEVDGELQAALSVGDRSYIADPFRPTREVVALLELHAARLGQDEPGLMARMADRLSLWSRLWFRAQTLHPTH